MMMAHPLLALSGGLCLVAAYGTSRLLNLEETFLRSGFYTYNPLLVGLSLAFLFPLQIQGLFLIAIAGAFSFLVTLLMADLFWRYFALPVLSLPFVLVSSIFYLSCICYPTLKVNMITQPVVVINLPYWLAGYFRSFALILFCPDVWLGIVISLLVLLYSPILFLLSLIGYYGGVGAKILLTGSTAAFFDPLTFNYILTAMAIGSFLIPCTRTYFLVMIATGVLAIFQDFLVIFLSTWRIPLFTLSFNIVTLSMSYILTIARHPMLSPRKDKPEENLEQFLTSKMRFRGNWRTLHLPFSGRWTVWQGFDGQWTHSGNWRYAYDFVITDEDNRTYRGEGKSLSDYYCFKKPVFSPIFGRVVKVVSNLPDNPIGSVEEDKNWGNLIIIEDHRGFFVEISHFACNSIRVKEGDPVEQNTLLGLCGNSGYSPLPHIHIQVQPTGIIGDITLPFSFVSYTDGSKYHANDLPQLGSQVEPLQQDKFLHQATTFLLDDVLEFEVFQQEKRIEKLTMTVKINDQGAFYFETPKGRLYFGKHEGTFYFYRLEGRDPWLRQMFLALPRLPLSRNTRLTWTDYVPLGVAVPSIFSLFGRFLSSFFPSFACLPSKLRFHGRHEILSSVSSSSLGFRKESKVTLDHKLGITSFKIDDLEIKRVNNAAKIEGIPMDHPKYFQGSDSSREEVPWDEDTISAAG